MAVLITEEAIMKKQALTLIGVLSLVLAAGSAFAQSDEVRATVPFDFVAGQTAVPPAPTRSRDST
jgi:hypothetical protein